jgi:hypothetical protein
VKDFFRRIQQIRDEFESSKRMTMHSNQGLNTRFEEIKRDIEAELESHKRMTHAKSEKATSEMDTLRIEIEMLKSDKLRNAKEIESKFKTMSDELSRKNDQLISELKSEFDILKDVHTRAALTGVDSIESAPGFAVNEQSLQQITASINHSVFEYVKSLLAEEINRIKEPVKKDVFDGIIQHIDQHLESVLKGFLPGISEAAQCAASIQSLHEQLGHETLQLSSHNSILQSLQQNVSVIEGIIGHFDQLAHRSDLDEVSQKVLILEQLTEEFDSSIEIQMREITAEVMNLKHMNTKIKPENGEAGDFKSEIASMEHRITDQIRRHVEETLNKSSPPPLMDESTIDSIVQRVTQSSRFNTSVDMMVLGGLRSHEYDLPSRVHKIEQYIATKSQIAPAFNVFSEGDGSAGAMYTPASEARR